ncbi:HAMP domain-containing sensor histidine kinase [Enterococcus sp. DIV0212c]|uniref:sensor histidine kinase n=1 Tax=Enterococcus sp. DIV0212c TaxID=2230867 RepID=UPI001A9B5B17|nr:HAMP domain-containing sensor histidine kinase [Enterococcus sp. DIV0212c]
MKDKLTFQFKIWLFSLSIVFLTLLCGFLVFYYATSFYLNKNQVNNFKNTTEEVAQIIKEKGIDKDLLDGFFQKGYTLRVKEAEQIVYPASISLNLSKTHTEKDPFMQPSINSNHKKNEVSILVHEQTVTHDGKQYSLSIGYIITVTANDYRDVLIKALPVFLIVGGIVAAAISMIYAKFFSRKIQKINNIAENISRLTHRSLQDGDSPQSKDEMEQLIAYLNSIYHELFTALEQLEKELTYSKRLENDRELFIKGVTHELKTPMMAIGTMIEGMLSSYPEYEDKELYLHKCYRELQSMTKLVNEILETSKLDNIQFKGKTNLENSLLEVMSYYDILFEDKKLTRTVMVDSDLEYGIPKKYLLKVLSNLVGNSVKYSPESSEVKIITEGNSLVVINEMSQSLGLLDTTTIFDPFYSNHEESSEEGHGLGLYIVKKILMVYDYQISCQIDGQTIYMTITPQMT